MAVYVIYTRAGNEEKLRDKITDLVLLPGDEVYIPMYNRQKKYEGEYRVVTRPLFQGYVFYETEDGISLWERLRKITDIKKLLRDGDDEVAPLKKEEEILLYKLCGKEHVLDISEGYKEGSRVRVIKGPLMGQEALIKKVNRHKRIAVIEIDMFQRKMELVVGLQILQ